MPLWRSTDRREQPVPSANSGLAESVLSSAAGAEGGLITGIATYEPEQWEAFLASSTDRDALEDTWEKWNGGLHRLTAELDAKKVPYVLVELDVDEINEFCRREGVRNDGSARAKLARLKALDQNGEEGSAP